MGKDSWPYIPSYGALDLNTRLSAPRAISYVRYGEIDIRKTYNARQSCVYNSKILWLLVIHELE